MGEIEWLKLSAATFEDEKLELMQAMPEGDALALMWIKLICLARRTNDQGLIYITPEIPYTEDLLAAKWKKPATLVRLFLETARRLKMIEIWPDGKVWLRNWGKYQSLEGLEKVREQYRIRTARYRRKAVKRLMKGDTDSNRYDVTQCHVTRHVTGHDDVTQCHDAEERDRELREGESAGTELEPESPSPETKTESKREYAKDVWLTESEYETLIADYSESEVKTLIGEMSNALGNTVPMNRYKSHYKALRNWIDKRRSDLAAKGIVSPSTVRVGVKDTTCPDCGKQYWGSACACGWGEQLLREEGPRSGEGKA
jgi:predicted phage replisome organizer